MACLKTLSSYDIVCARSRSHHERTSQPWTMSISAGGPWSSLTNSTAPILIFNQASHHLPNPERLLSTAQRNLERKARHGNPPMHHYRPKSVRSSGLKQRSPASNKERCPRGGLSPITMASRPLTQPCSHPSLLVFDHMCLVGLVSRRASHAHIFFGIKAHADREDL
jgi:hypothetical protein